MATGMYYWVGQDGNIWYKDSQSTRNMGPAAANAGNPAPDANGFYDPWADKTETATRFNATQIADPMVQQQQQAAPTGGSVAAPAPVFNQAGADNTQRTIDQIAPLLQAALGAEGTRYQNAKNDFDASQKVQQGAYDTGTTTNQLNYDSNFMDSIRAGIKGLGGLMALLRGTGGGGGTAEDIARDTVGGVTAGDIRGGKDTRDENQGQLDTSLGTFLTDLQRKRQVGEDTRVNNERAIRRDSSTKLQDLFGKMAGFFGDVGNTSATNDWMARAGALTPDIAANSSAQVSPYDTTPVVPRAPNLTAFAPSTQPSVVTAPGGQVGSGIFTMSDPRRRREAALAGV